MVIIIPAAGPAGNRGFSLVELTVVMAIMAVLVSSAMPLYELTAQREKEKELRVGLRQIRKRWMPIRAVNEGRVARKRRIGLSAQLEDLIAGVPDAKDPENARSILRRLPRDPMSTTRRWLMPKPVASVSYESPRTIRRRVTMF